MDTEEFGYFEVRVRDPKWLTERNALKRRDEYDRADCCWDRAAGVFEIPRQRQLSPTRIIDLAPARFRLCRHHGLILLARDQLATGFWFSEGPLRD